MSYKKIISILAALCMTVPAINYTYMPICNTVYALETQNVGSITLDNNHSSANASLTNTQNLVWSSSDENVAEVDRNGTITAVGKGTCVISASDGEHVYTINVTSNYEPEENNTTVDMGTMTFTNDIIQRQITFDVPDGTKITYTTTDSDVAVVDENGLVTAKGMGKCQIFADIDSIHYIFNVTSVYTGEQTGIISIGEISLTAESPMQTINISGLAKDSPIMWRCSDENIAVVSKGGVVSGIKQGNCTVYADVDGKTYAISINVSFDVEDIMQSFTIKGINGYVTLSFSSMTDDVVYTSSDSSIAEVNEKGTITAKNYGTAVIKAESTGGIMWVQVEVVKAGLAGDANTDGNVNIADATAIVQYIANSDKYALSDEGLANADVDGLKGITGMDAYAIQQLEVGIVKSLPLEQTS